MPRDLPTRRVFLSRSHFVSFHTTKYYYVWSPTQKWKKWRRSTMLFFYPGLYHVVHVPLLWLTCGTSSTCRVWHPSS